MNKEMDCQNLDLPDQNSHLLLLSNTKICLTNHFYPGTLNYEDWVPHLWLEVFSQGIAGSWEGCRVKGRAMDSSRRSQEARRLGHTSLPHQKLVVQVISSVGCGKLRPHVVRQGLASRGCIMQLGG